MSFFEFPHTRTYDDDLGWLIKIVRKLVDCCDSMNEWKETHETQYHELKALYDDIMMEKFPPTIINAFNEWMRKNALDLVGDLVNVVFFGLTDSGYFVAYIPESWDEIDFHTTGWDIDIPYFEEYGHLTLSFNIGGR